VFSVSFVEEKMQQFKIWFQATRPWSLTASFIPVTLGAVLAAYPDGQFHWLIYLLTVVGGCSLHLGTNMINTYGDFIAGVDTKESAVTCPQLTHGILTPKAVWRAGVIFFALAALLGVYFVWLRGLPMLIVWLIGIVFGYGYTAGMAYKFKGLGVPFVFVLMGPLMVWGGHYMQTGEFSWVPVLASIPIGFLVSGILHGNDYRDMIHDKNAGITTTALMLGNNASQILQWLLAVLPMLSLPILAGLGIIPWTAMLPWLLLPMVFINVKAGIEAKKGSREKLGMLELMGVKLHLSFGVLMIVGVIAGTFFS
jgi:1,4-dihydroxy-2-naphthoate octaprenyltransferase